MYIMPHKAISVAYVINSTHQSYQHSSLTGIEKLLEDKKKRAFSSIHTGRPTAERISSGDKQIPSLA
jgi:hypothetical protein